MPPAITTPVLKVEAARTSAPRPEPYERKSNRARSSATIRSVAAVLPKSLHVASPAIPVLPEPPHLAGQPASYGELFSPASKILQPEIPQIPDPLVSVSASPVPQPHRGGLFRKLGLSGKSDKAAEFVPPRPIREPATELPPELRHRLKNQVAMNVKVYIGRDGKVSYAELLSNGTGSNRDLATLAVFASRRWEFSPARLGDQTVPAEAILRFRFGPEVR
jgi:outer membrane biosynthesis protein TonB